METEMIGFSKVSSVVLICAALIVAGFATAGFGRPTAGFGGPAPERAGLSATVDFSRALSEHQGMDANQAELEKIARESQDKLDGMRQELDQLRGELMVYAKGSREAFNKEAALERKKLEFDIAGRNLQFELESRKAEILKAACAEVEDAVGKYCREHGIDIVYAAPYSVQKVKSSDPTDFLKWLSEVDVVWADDSLDITDAIITIVNGS